MILELIEQWTGQTLKDRDIKRKKKEDSDFYDEQR